MKKFLYLLLIPFVLVFTLILCNNFVLASNTGAKFSTVQHEMSKPLDFMPRTLDAEIFIPKSYNDRAGVIMGSYGSGADCISFEIYSNGAPRLYYTDKMGNVYNYIFSNVDVRSENGPVRLSIVQDPFTSKITCYIDGVEKQTLDASNLPNEILLSRTQMIGGDYRSGNTQYFKGIIYKFDVYSEVLSTEQIVNKNGSGLMVSYDFTTDNNQNIDLSEHGYDLSGIFEFADSNDLFSSNEPIIKDGLSFSASEQYVTSNDGLSDTAYTYSAWVYLSKNHSERGGVIIGNYESGGIPCVSFEIHTSGAPRFYQIDSNNKITDVVFSNVDIRSGEWTLLVYSVSDRVVCYVNGVKVGERSIGALDEAAISKPFALGGDFRSGNAQNFKGRIREVTLLNKNLTDDEVNLLYSGSYESLNNNIIANYDLKTAVVNKDIKDISGNNNTFYSKIKFFDNKEPVKDFSYSFAFVGDTQIVTESYPDKLSKIYDWLINNKDNKKIQYVFGLGDITNSDTDREWNNALTQISKLNDRIPYSLVRGNHDSTSQFEKYFNTNIYKNQFEGFYNDSINNSWRTFKAGKVNYLLITFDYGPDDDVLNWASEIIENHPNHQVIITTHAYMFRDGTTLDKNDVWPPSSTGGVNDGDDIWEKLVSKHENIVLVVSGHDPCDKIVAKQEKGEKGNTVTQILIDPQGVDSALGATGMVALFHFSEDGSELQIEYYSTVLEQYFLLENQFSLTLPVSHIQSEVEDNSASVSIDLSQTDDQIIEDNGFDYWIILYIVSGIVVLALIFVLIKRKNN